MVVIVYGVGNTWNRLSEYIDHSKCSISGFVDSNPEGKNPTVLGERFAVMRPTELLISTVRYDKIAIFSIYDNEIINDLVQLGIDKDKIMSLDEVRHNLLTHYYHDIERINDRIDYLEKQLEREREITSRLSARILRSTIRTVNSLQDVEFRVYSQWGEDGIVWFLTHIIPITNKKFVEFGVEDYRESNTRYLLVEDNWSGLIMDSSGSNIENIKRQEIYWRYDILAKEAFITKNNVNELIKSAGFEDDIGLLSIDIDGMDYWIFDAIEVVAPRIVICEFNPVFGYKEAVTVPYQKEFKRFEAHYSGVYFGASLKAIQFLANKKGYIYIGMNSNACNAFFVRNDFAKYVPKSILESVKEYKGKYRSSKDKDGKLSYLSITEIRRIIGHLPLYKVDTGEECILDDIDY